MSANGKQSFLMTHRGTGLSSRILRTLDARHPIIRSRVRHCLCSRRYKILPARPSCRKMSPLWPASRGSFFIVPTTVISIFYLYFPHPSPHSRVYPLLYWLLDRHGRSWYLLTIWISLLLCLLPVFWVLHFWSCTLRRVASRGVHYLLGARSYSHRARSLEWSREVLRCIRRYYWSRVRYICVVFREIFPEHQWYIPRNQMVRDFHGNLSQYRRWVFLFLSSWRRKDLPIFPHNRADASFLSMTGALGIMWCKYNTTVFVSVWVSVFR